MAKRLAHFAPGPVHLQAAICEMKSVSENALCMAGFMVRRRKLACRLLMPAPQNRDNVLKKGSLDPEEMEVPTCRRRCELEIASHVVSDPCADSRRRAVPFTGWASAK
jgi:hypothetical protein